MLSFQHKQRENEAGKQMQPVVEKLELADMVAIAAYLGSLYPTPPVAPPPPPAPAAQ